MESVPRDSSGYAKYLRPAVKLAPVIFLLRGVTGYNIYILQFRRLQLISSYFLRLRGWLSLSQVSWGFYTAVIRVLLGWSPLQDQLG